MLLAGPEYGKLVPGASCVEQDRAHAPRETAWIHIGITGSLLDKRGQIMTAMHDMRTARISPPKYFIYFYLRKCQCQAQERLVNGFPL